MTASTKHDFNYDDVFPERWLHADDLRDEEGHLRDVTRTITDVYLDTLRIPGSRPSEAAVVSFLNTKREYVLNKTNARFLKAHFGKMSGDAVGNKVTLHPVADESGKSNSGYRILFIDPPATVDPVTGEVGDDDIGFTEEAPHAEEAVSSTQMPQISDAVDEGGPYASAEEDAENGDIPGRGALFNTDDPKRPATGRDKKALSEALAHVDGAAVKEYRKRFGGRGNSELTHGECDEFKAWAVKEAGA